MTTLYFRRNIEVIYFYGVYCYHKMKQNNNQTNHYFAELTTFLEDL